MKTQVPSRIEEVLTFWFEGVDDSALIEQKGPPYNKWFVKNPKFDEDIRTRFTALLQEADEGKCSDWEKSPRGTLALIIVFDQFSRNMYHGTRQMFAYDKKALFLSQSAIQQNKDRAFSLIERTFLYMPFMHAEDRAAQELSLLCFGRLVEESKKINPLNTPYFRYSLDYARRHSAIIERFGRFPHRNALLKRPSTLEESAFLQKPGSSF